MGRPKGLIQRNHRKEQIAAGLCVVKGCKNFPIVNHRMCQKHRDITLAKRQQSDRERFSMNLCNYTGSCKERPVGGLKICQTHLALAAVSRRHWQYGFTPEQEQRYQDAVRCDWCGNELINGDVHIDHDHSCCPGKRSCGKCVRGFLHEMCNAHGLSWAEWFEKTFGITDTRLQTYRLLKF
jgi:hypothetical protein